MKRSFLVLALVLASAVPGLAAGDAARGASIFTKCRACHATGEGAQNRVGPQLNGVVGRPAGSAPDYNYSVAMRDAAAGGLVWDEANLAQFLSKPRAFVPGTKMAFAGVTSPDDVANIIAYLASFPAPATP